jgi:POT family proton-dependent oligopeptide transporter
MTSGGDQQQQGWFREIVQPFIDLVHAPRALMGINVPYFLEGMVYFGILGYLAMYFNDYMGLNDVWAGRMVGVLTAGITIAMFFLGTVADRKGVRYALILAFICMLGGRLLLSAAPVVDPSHVDLTTEEAGRNDPVFVFTDAKPLPAGPAATQPMEPQGPAENEVPPAPVPTGEPAARATVEAETPAAPGTAEVSTPSSGLGSLGLFVAMFGIIMVVIGYGMYQPGAYAAVRQFTDAKTAGMGYAMLYALMNLGGWIPTLAFLLRNNRAELLGVEVPGAGLGILGTIWIYTAATLLALISTYLILSRHTVKEAIARARALREAAKVQTGGGAVTEESGAAESATAMAESGKPSQVQGFWPVIWDYIVNHPLRNGKFAFFIFCLIPVQTLFAHNWLTLPMYVERAYRTTWPWISQNFEPAVNFNPLLVFIFVPIVTAKTQNRKVYNMMILGTTVMALPTFLLAIGPYWWTLLAFLVIMTIGEAMWQPRFLQYAAEIAPEGRTGAYMGVAQFPWFLTKVIVPLYSGVFLQKYVPERGPASSEVMWMIYGLIAVMSPIMLILARNWLGRDFKTKADS